MAEGVNAGSGIGAWLQTTVSRLSNSFKKGKVFGRFKNVESVSPRKSVRAGQSSFSNPAPRAKIYSRTARHATKDQVVSIQSRREKLKANSQSLGVSLLTLNLQRDGQAATLAHATSLKEAVKEEIRTALKQSPLKVREFLDQPENAKLKEKWTAAWKHEKNEQVALANTEQQIANIETILQANESVQQQELEAELQRLLNGQQDR